MGASRPTDVEFMECALEQAAAAEAAGEVPVGAVLVLEDAIIARAHNRPIGACDPTAHAEIEALRAGGRRLASYRLSDTTLYVTLEPCMMCASALLLARVRRVVFGAFDAQAGAAGSRIDVFRSHATNHHIDVFGGVLADRCAEQLRGFFERRRAGAPQS
jgi:tRNA(Arg) A34 adenosine deaminase TadA